MNPYKRYLQTSFYGFIAAALIACGGSSVQPVKPHPYVSATEQLETLASQAIQANHYGKAANLYQQAFTRYNALNDHSAMWRTGLNNLQMLIILAQWPQADQQVDLLTQLNTYTAPVKPAYLEQLKLLKSHIAIAKEDWHQAESLLKTIKNEQFTTAKLLNTAIIASHQNQTEARPLIQQLKASPLQALELARVLRLEAQIISQPEKAEALLKQALDIYKQQYFLPGTMACYKALAALFENTPKGHWYNKRYKTTEALLKTP